MRLKIGSIVKVTKKYSVAYESLQGKVGKVIGILQRNPYHASDEDICCIMFENWNEGHDGASWLRIKRSPNGVVEVDGNLSKYNLSTNCWNISPRYLEVLRSGLRYQQFELF